VPPQNETTAVIASLVARMSETPVTVPRQASVTISRPSHQDTRAPTPAASFAVFDTPVSPSPSLPEPDNAADNPAHARQLLPPDSTDDEAEDDIGDQFVPESDAPDSTDEDAEDDIGDQFVPESDAPDSTDEDAEDDIGNQFVQEAAARDDTGHDNDADIEPPDPRRAAANRPHNRRHLPPDLPTHYANYYLGNRRTPTSDTQNDPIGPIPIREWRGRPPESNEGNR
jgi:hypothetical protein